MLNYSDSLYPDSDQDADGQEESIFLVNGGGQKKLFSEDRFFVKKNAAGSDWSLFYIAEGYAHFRIQGKNVTVGAGHLVLFHPGSPQYCLCVRKDCPNVYWICLTGNAVSKTLSELSLLQDKISFVGVSASFSALLEKIIRELHEKNFGRSVMCNGLAMELLAEFGRAKKNAPMTVADAEYAIQRTTEEIQKYYQETRSVENYAHMCNMSISWFIRQFKAYTGVSPQQYIIRVRMEKACRLLEETSFRVSEIALMVGYENPLYFSRLFKKNTGDSPSGYRQRKNNLSADFFQSVEDRAGAD